MVYSRTSKQDYEYNLFNNNRTYNHYDFTDYNNYDFTNYNNYDKKDTR